MSTLSSADAGAPVTPLTLADLPEMSFAELRSSGVLQEVNRWFFHPLGLALTVAEDPLDRRGRRLLVIDSRDDLEGVRFDDVTDEMRARGEAVKADFNGRSIVREDRLGYVVQPILDDEIKEHTHE